MSNLIPVPKPGEQVAFVILNADTCNTHNYSQRLTVARMSHLAERLFFDVPSMSLKQLHNYGNYLSEARCPYRAVVTRVRPASDVYVSEVGDLPPHLFKDILYFSFERYLSAREWQYVNGEEVA